MKLVFSNQIIIITIRWYFPKEKENTLSPASWNKFLRDFQRECLKYSVWTARVNSRQEIFFVDCVLSSWDCCCWQYRQNKLTEVRKTCCRLDLELRVFCQTLFPNLYPPVWINNKLYQMSFKGLFTMSEAIPNNSRHNCRNYSPFLLLLQVTPRYRSMPGITR